MPKVSRETAPQVEDMGVMEGRYGQLDGYVVGFETFREDADATPLFRGLPDDRCQSRHWGYVVQGSVGVLEPDRALDDVAPVAALAAVVRQPAEERCRVRVLAERLEADDVAVELAVAALHHAHVLDLRRRLTCNLGHRL